MQAGRVSAGLSRRISLAVRRATAFRASTKSDVKYIYMPFTVITIGALLMYGALHAQENEFLAQRMQNSANLLADDVKRTAKKHILALQRMAQRWEIRGGTPIREWQADANRYVTDIPGLAVVEWIPAHSTRAYEEISPDLKSEELKQELRAHIAANTDNASRTPEKISVVPFFSQKSDFSGFTVYRPLYVYDRFQGFLAGTFDADAFIKNIMADMAPDERLWRLYFENSVIAENTKGEDIASTAMRDVDIYGGIWRFELLESHAAHHAGHSYTGYISLAAGLLLALVSGFAGHYLREALTLQHISEIQRRRIAAILTYAGDGIWGFNAKGASIFANEAARHMTGVGENEDIRSFNPFSSEADGQGMDTEQRFNDVLTGRSGAICYSGDYLLKRTGGRFTAEYSLTSVTDENGKICGAIATFRDITARSRTEAELVKAKNDAMAAAVAKTEFLAGMSHEIRTPLNGVMGFLSLLQADETDESRLRYMHSAMRSGEVLLNLLDDILDFCKMEHNGVALSCAEVDLIALTEQAAENASAKAGEKGLRLYVNYEARAPRRAECDGMRIQQILANLLDNAIKFSDKGDVALSVTAKTGNDGMTRYVFAVSDDGIGVPEEQRAVIFEKFHKADSSFSAKHGGIGMGLAVCGRLAALMKGDIAVTSSKTGGSVFSFSVTLQTQKDEECAAPPLYRNAVIISSSAESFACACVENILDRLRIGCHRSDRSAVPLERNVDFGIYIADRDAASVPPAPLSPHCSRFAAVLPFPPRYRELEELHRKGYSGCIVFPCVHDALSDVLQDWSAEKESFAMRYKYGSIQSADIGANRIDRKLFEKTRILLAEDNSVNQMVTTLMLEKLGCDVDHAGDGIEAEALYRSNAYDAVLMDCHMPRQDGFGAARAICAYRESSGKPNVPIIACTANASESERNACLESGMCDHIAKPFKLEELADMLKKWAPSKLAAQSMPPAETKAELTPAKEELIDRNRLSQFCEIMGDRTEKAFEMYSQTQSELLRQLRNAVKSGNRKEIVLAAHTLKSAAAQIGAARVSELAALMEARLKTEAPEGEAWAAQEKRLYACCDDSLESLRTILKSHG